MSLRSAMTSYDDTIDFRKVWKVGTSVSLLVLLISIVSLVGQGLNLGLDFEGGTSWDVPGRSFSVDEARDALPASENGAKIQVIGRGDTRVVRVQTDLDDPGGQNEITAALAEAASVDADDVTVSTVGPSWGQQVTDKAVNALIWFFVAIALYIAWRLEWKMAVGGLASVAHDLVICVGFYSLFQIEVTPATVIAFLTILGYSLYDTIVVFDRMQENEAKLKGTGRITYSKVASLSLNQVLMRSINATISSLLPVLGMLIVGSFIMGAAVLEEFALALTVGIVVGAFSSILIATPVVVWIKEREPRYREIRTQIAERGGSPIADPLPTKRDDGVAGSTAPAGPATSTATVDKPALSGRAIPPRPRKKGRKR